MYLTQKQVDRYTATVKNTVKWAYANRQRLMAEPDMQAHYKAPYFWACVGDMQMAGLHRHHIARKFFRTDGDFRSEEDAKGFYVFPCTVHNQYIYPNGWLVSGMQKLGAYDLSNRGLEFILKFQDLDHGGFYFAFDAANKQIDKSLMDSSSTSAAGMACLMCGRLAEARRAGNFILDLLGMQPHPDKYFYSCRRADGTLHTDVFGSEAARDPNGRKQKCLSAQEDGHNELTWLIGKPTKFLTRLYTATGDRKYLEGAKQAFFFFHKLHENAWTNYASCKTMWAGAELYRLTGEKVFAETAIRILEFYCDTQSPSGSWVHTLWYQDESQQDFTWTADITFEYGGEISDVILDLCSC